LDELTQQLLPEDLRLVDSDKMVLHLYVGVGWLLVSKRLRRVLLGYSGVDWELLTVEFGGCTLSSGLGWY
jgi:hypothetical protein